VASMNRLIKKIDNCGSAERKSGSGRARSLRIADNVSMIQDMICSQYDAPCPLAVIKTLVKYKNILNTATSLEYFILSALQLLLWLLADHNIKNQTFASILAAVCVLLGSAITE